MPKVDLPTGERFHGTAASSWAEVDSSFMDEPVYVVMKRDGKPLSEKDGRLSWSYRPNHVRCVDGNRCSGSRHPGVESLARRPLGRSAAMNSGGDGGLTPSGRARSRVEANRGVFRLPWIGPR